MKEVEVVTTIQITDIFRDVPDDFCLDKKEWAKAVEKRVGVFFDPDDALVTNVQEIVRDEK